jgi:hypothetical protein
MDGVILTLAQEGAFVGWCNPQRWNLSVDICGLGNVVKDCGDLLAMHQRKCTLGKIKTLSHLASDGITNLWGKVVQPLLSVNSHDSRAHDHEWHEPFTRLVGLWLVWIWSGNWVWLVWQQRWDMWALFGLATGVRQVSSVWFGYRGETRELYLF